MPSTASTSAEPPGERRLGRAKTVKEPGESTGTRYSSVAHALKAEIAEGHHDIGSRLPTEFELCQRFGVSRSTVRQALVELESAGLVRRRQGSGTTVVAREPALRYSLSVNSEADILRFASETMLALTEFGVPVTSVDGRRLRLGTPTQWRVWRGLRQMATDGSPLGIAAVYVPATYTPLMKALGQSTTRAIFEYLAEANGLTITTIEQEISATMVDLEESEVLKTPPGTPALAVMRRFVAGQRLIEVSETIFPTDRFTYSLRLERNATGRLPL
jgi:GntR family transcriptional regulator